MPFGMTLAVMHFSTALISLNGIANYKLWDQVTVRRARYMFFFQNSLYLLLPALLEILNTYSCKPAKNIGFEAYVMLSHVHVSLRKDLFFQSTLVHYTTATTR